MPPKKTRTPISFEAKKEICEYIQTNPNAKQVNVASYFNTKYPGYNIDRSTIAKIWQDRDKWLAILSNIQTPHIFRQRSVLFPIFDKAMQIWTSQAVANGIPLSDMILQEKGLEFAKSLKIEDKIKCANGWIYKFKQRNGLRKVNYSGEANSAPLATLPEERSRLQKLLANYNREDIYNADETGLFFRMEPNQTLSTGKSSGRKKVRYFLKDLLFI
jgi:hypothetical protein